METTKCHMFPFARFNLSLSDLTTEDCSALFSLANRTAVKELEINGYFDTGALYDSPSRGLR